MTSMQVVATAGHVDHGKSALVRALTGMEPDRWAEEVRRGMTIDLGYAWTRLASGLLVAFVDVPGHERFATNMLAGVGPVPIVLLVVAADEGWSAQTEEHVRALDALGVSRGLLVVTKSDLADPGPVADRSLRRLASTSLAGIASVAVSAATGEGLEELREALARLLESVPTPDPAARVRLWVDRSFTIRGAGTVVTGTLAAGTVRRGDSLELRGRQVTVRGVQCLGETTDRAVAPARAALNLRGVDHGDVRRGDALLTPNAWRLTGEADVRAAADLPERLVLHIGAAAIPVRVRRLGGGGDGPAARDGAARPGGAALRDPGPDGGGGARRGAAALYRLSLSDAVPLQVGDRALLREPGRRQVICGVTVLDPAPPPLRRRGSARARSAALEASSGEPLLADELRRRGAVPRSLLLALGVPVPAALPDEVREAAGWLIATDRWAGWVDAVRRVVRGRAGGGLLEAGVPDAEVVRAAGLPAPQILPALLRDAPELEEAGGQVRPRGATPAVSPALAACIARLREQLSGRPFAAPDARELQALGFGRAELGAAAAARLVLRLPGDVVLLPDAPQRAAELLRRLPQPFTASAAREALGTSRRVAIPLLEHLDRVGLTQRVDADRRRLRGAAGPAPGERPGAPRADAAAPVAGEAGTTPRASPS